MLLKCFPNKWISCYKYVQCTFKITNTQSVYIASYNADIKHKYLNLLLCNIHLYIPANYTKSKQTITAIERSYELFIIR